MTQGVLDLINAIDSGDSQLIDAAFNAEMASRVSDRLEDMRIDVAENMFAEASCSSKKMEKEELHPNQVKLDKNKNGKLDADDFKKLRKEELDEAAIKQFMGMYQVWHKGKKVASYASKTDAQDHANSLKEEVEELDELSKKTLGSYVRKASIDVVDAVHGERDAESDEEHDAQEYHARRVQNRMSGLERVGKKLAKEGMEEFAKSQAKKRAEARKAKEKMSEEFTLEDYTLEEIQDFMMSEDFEQLDEISKATLGSYVKKAATSLSKASHDLGDKRAQSSEVDRFTNRHMPDKYNAQDKMKDNLGVGHTAQSKDVSTIVKRTRGITTAVGKLTK